MNPSPGVPSPADLPPSRAHLGDPVRTLLAERWGWFVALGILLLFLGFVALGETFAVTVAAVWFFGVLLLVSAGGHLVHAVSTRGWSGALLEVLLAILATVAGVGALLYPVGTSMVLTLMLGVSILCQGITRTILALTNRHCSSWPLMLLGGFISCLLGGMILGQWPKSSLFVIGLFVAIDLISSGISWLTLGFTARNLRAAN